MFQVEPQTYLEGGGREGWVEGGGGGRGQDFSEKSIIPQPSSTVHLAVYHFLTIRSADMFAVIGRGLFYEVAPTRFGTLGKAFFTLFQLITLDDWFYMYSDVVAKNPGQSQSPPFFVWLCFCSRTEVSGTLQ